MSGWCLFQAKSVGSQCQSLSLHSDRAAQIWSSRDVACFKPTGIAAAGPLGCVQGPWHRHTRPCRAQIGPLLAPLAQAETSNSESVSTAVVQSKQSSSVVSYAEVTSVVGDRINFTPQTSAVAVNQSSNIAGRWNGLGQPAAEMLSAASITAERQPFESTAASVQSVQHAASRPAITLVTDVGPTVEAGSASVAAAMGWWRRRPAVRASMAEAAVWGMTWLRQ